jgi:hypothetical protein
VSATAPRRDRRSRRRRRLLRFWIWAAVLTAVLGLGIALGQSFDDNPTPGGTQTSVRTLKPLPLAPVTVTVTTP